MSQFVRCSLKIWILRSLALLFLLLWTANTVQAQSSISLVQGAGKDGGTTTISSLAFARPNTAGNWIAVCVRAGFSSSQVFTVKDFNGNIYQRAAQVGFTASAVTLAIYYAENIKEGANTVTVSDTVSAPLRLVILEYSGVATANSLDGASIATGNSAWPMSGSLTTTANRDLLLGAIATTNPASVTADSGYTIRDFVPAEPVTKLIAEDQIQAAAGLASAGASLTASDSWGAVLAAVKPAGGTSAASPTITGLSPTSGPVGTSVTITGTNFGSTQDTSTVTFNGTTAAPTSWSATNIVAPAPAGATSGNVVVTVGGAASNGAGFTVTSTPVAPSITQQPSNQAVTAGQTATFTVTATGIAPLNYQWQKNGSNISGATSSIYTTPTATTSDNGSTFVVLVSNSAGAATSNPATLTVNAVPPTITTQPANQTVTAGKTATFMVAVTGTAPLSYHWQKNRANISGATSSSYTTSATTTSDSGSTFVVMVSNSAGTATSNAATLTVNPAPAAPTITTQPASQTATAGQTATFTVTATGTAPLNYQWQKNGANISGATSSSYTTSATTTGDSGSTFDVVVSNSAGMVTSASATLTVTTANTSGWTFVQEGLDSYCVPGRSSCAFDAGTIAPTTAGTVRVIFLRTANASNAPNVTITSVTGAGSTWNLCPASSCHILGNDDLDMAYAIGGSGGSTSITVNLSGASGSAFFTVILYEFLPPAGSTASFDANTTANHTCTSGTTTGVSLPVTATDLILQTRGNGDPSTWDSYSSSYIQTMFNNAISLNDSTGTAPSISCTGSSMIFSAIAFKSTAGVFTPPTNKMQAVNYVNTGKGLNCSPSCSMTISSTGSGNLLYVEAADITGAYISSISGGGTWVVPSTCQIGMASQTGNTAGYLSCAYVLSTTPGTTSLAITMTGSTNAYFAVMEISSLVGGTFSLDMIGATLNAASFNPLGQALTLSGNDDVIFQSIFVPGGTTSVTYYPFPPSATKQAQMFFNNQAGFAALTDATTGVQPQWAEQGGNLKTIVTGVAFKTM